MIDVHNLVVTQWDYLPTIEDAGMMPTYQAYFTSHPFPCFIDPLRMAV